MTKTHNAFRTFNRWLLFFGLIVFAAYLLFEQGLFHSLIEQDESYLSIIILLFFTATSLQVGLQAFRLGRQVQQNDKLTQRARQPQALITGRGNDIEVGGEPMDTSLAHEHLGLLAEKYQAFGHITEQDLLLDRLDNKLRAGHETGWFIADLMIRLGLLGTVIGFIFMLGSISTISSVDIQALQQLLSTMSGGMRVALYTTLAGLSTGMLLSFQYQLLDQGADCLLADIIELSEVHAIPHLRDLTQAANS